MIKEIRKIKSRGKANWIRQLLWRNKLNTYFSGEKGYVAYNTEELKEYSKMARRGRPPKERKEN